MFKYFHLKNFVLDKPEKLESFSGRKKLVPLIGEGIPEGEDRRLLSDVLAKSQTREVKEDTKINLDKILSEKGVPENVKKAVLAKVLKGKNEKLVATSIYTVKMIDSKEGDGLRKRFSYDLEELKRKIAVGDSLVFVDGAKQRTYLLVRRSERFFDFVKQFIVSTAKDGFTRKGENLKTPIGFFIVKVPEDHVKSNFGERILHGVPKGRFPDRIDELSTGDSKDWVTTYILYFYKSEVGIAVHGTNREIDLGKPASHGCIRMSNIDVIELEEDIKKLLSSGKRRVNVYVTDKPKN